MGVELQKERMHPAKAFLRQYRGLRLYADSLSEQLTGCRERATDISAKLRPVAVMGSGPSDVIGEAAAQAADIEARLGTALLEVQEQLRRIIDAVDSVPDGLQKTILMRRYIQGESWDDICQAIGYEKTKAFEIHGWALDSVLRWMTEAGI